LAYEHVATKNVRRTEITWEGTQELDLHEKLQQSAVAEHFSIQDYIKALLRNIPMLVLSSILLLTLLFVVHQATTDK
jgi:hypothetical protein